MRILVTDGNERAALAIIRSLGKAGHEVHVAAPTKSSITGASRFSARSWVAPNALTQPDEFSRWLLKVARDYQVVLPITDASLGLALSMQDDLARQGVIVPFANHRCYRDISDKRLVLERAQQLGISVPAQRVVHGRMSQTELANLSYPLVVKPARSVVRAGSYQEKTRVQYAHSANELAALLDLLPDAAYPVLLQQKIEGPGVGVFVLLWNGKVIAQFAHKRLREKPPWGGVSVLRESYAVDNTLMSRSIELLTAFAWQGPAMVEYKLDQRSQRAFLMEINGRYWGSLQLAIDAGIDFPRLHVSCAMGEDPPPATSYPTSVVTRWLLGDLDQLLIQLRRRRCDAGDAPTGLSRRGAVWAFVRAFHPRVRNEIFHWSDPQPALTEFVRWLSSR